jgi:hypothetical protein
MRFLPFGIAICCVITFGACFIAIMIFRFYEGIG